MHNHVEYIDVHLMFWQGLMNSATKQILAVLVPAVLVAGGELVYLTSRDVKPAAAAPVVKTAQAAVVPSPAPIVETKSKPIQVVQEAPAPGAESNEYAIVEERPQATSEPAAAAPVPVAPSAPAAQVVTPAAAPVVELRPVTPAPQTPKVRSNPSAPQQVPPVVAPQVASQNPPPPSTPAPVPVSVRHSISAYDNTVTPPPAPAPQKPNNAAQPTPAQRAMPMSTVTSLPAASASAEAPAQQSAAAAPAPAREEKIAAALKLARIDTSMTMKGVKLRFVTEEDEEIKWITGVFVSPSKKAEIPFSARQAATGRWEHTESFADARECGDWVLDHITIRDHTGAERTIGRENPEIKPHKFNVVKCDGQQETSR